MRSRKGPQRSSFHRPCGLLSTQIDLECWGNRFSKANLCQKSSKVSEQHRSNHEPVAMKACKFPGKWRQAFLLDNPVTRVHLDCLLRPGFPATWGRRTALAHTLPRFSPP